MGADGDIAVEAHVAGRVQGVAFRAWTRRRAVELGLRGWVRNEPDGSVRALLAGSESAIRTMLEALREGPPAARVDTLRAERSTDAAPPPGFEIIE